MQPDSHASHGSFPLPLSLTLIHIEDLISPVLAMWRGGRQCPISVFLLVPVTLVSLVACPLFMCGLERFRTSEYLDTALPWAGKGDHGNQIHLDEVHDLLIALVLKNLNLDQGPRSFSLPCIF